MSNASFSSMYRRGRYRTEYLEGDDATTKKRKQDRLELFTVAALAFVMKHERSFKRHFMKTICGVKLKDDENMDDYKVLLQPYDFDLVLRKEGDDSEVIVVESKINARLEEKQDVRENTFDRSPEGYGNQIQKHYANFKSLKYIILLQKENEDELREEMDRKGRIQWQSRFWENLLYHKEEEEPGLVKDLLNWLGEIIPEMRGRMFKEMKIAEFTKGATEMYGMLSFLSKDALGCDEPVFDVNSSGEEFWFGVNIPFDSGDFNWLRTPTRKRGPLGWFGYVQDGNETGLKIWIYTEGESEDKVKQIADSIKKQLYGIGDVKPDKDKNIIIRNNSDFRDMEWFQSVITKLKLIEKI